MVTYIMIFLASIIVNVLILSFCLCRISGKTRMAEDENIEYKIQEKEDIITIIN